MLHVSQLLSRPAEWPLLTSTCACVLNALMAVCSSAVPYTFCTALTFVCCCCCLWLQMAALRSRGRGEAARGAALAVAGGPSEPTQQQQLMERVSCNAEATHTARTACTACKCTACLYCVLPVLPGGQSGVEFHLCEPLPWVGRVSTREQALLVGRQLWCLFLDTKKTHDGRLTCPCSWVFCCSLPSVWRAPSP
jgi:hypothetical protein